MDGDENWLHGEKVICPECGEALYRVDHSPFYDEIFLYCDRCPIHVEVSYYDPVYSQMTDAFSVFEDRLRAIEDRLKPCTCGGRFRFAAPRRCLTCHAPVIVGDSAGVDLYFWTGLKLPDAPEPTSERMRAEEARLIPYARTRDLWRER